MEKYINYLTEIGKSENTIKTYINGINTFFKWYRHYYGEFIPKDVSVFDMKEYKDYLLNELNVHGKKKYAITTVNNKLMSVKNYFNYLLKEETIKENPSKYVPKQKIQLEDTIRWLDRNEKNRLLRYLEDPLIMQKNSKKACRNLAIVFFMLHAGLRISEVASLTVDDIENGFISVRDGKGSKARKVPMNSDLLHVYKNWTNYRNQIVFQSNINEVFISQKGNPLSINGIQNLFITIRKETGLNVTPHVLRHTFCHSLIEKGANLAYVAELAGHSNLNTTRLYILPSPTEKKDLVENLASGKYSKM